MANSIRATRQAVPMRIKTYVSHTPSLPSQFSRGGLSKNRNQIELFQRHLAPVENKYFINIICIQLRTCCFHQFSMNPFQFQSLIQRKICFKIVTSFGIASLFKNLTYNVTKCIKVSSVIGLLILHSSCPCQTYSNIFVKIAFKFDRYKSCHRVSVSGMCKMKPSRKVVKKFFDRYISHCKNVDSKG